MICTKYLAKGQRNSWVRIIISTIVSFALTFTLNHPPCKLRRYHLEKASRREVFALKRIINCLSHSHRRFRSMLGYHLIGVGKRSKVISRMNSTAQMLPDSELELIADNKLTENSSWNEELLKSAFTEISLLDPDISLDITGFDIGEIDRLILDDPASATEQPLPALATEAVSRLGDVERLSNHRLVCGNARDETSYRSVLAGLKAACLFSDPPHNVPIAGNVTRRNDHREFSMASGEMSEDDFTDFLTAVFSLSARIVCPALYISSAWTGVTSRNFCPLAKLLMSGSSGVSEPRPSPAKAAFTAASTNSSSRFWLFQAVTATIFVLAKASGEFGTLDAEVHLELSRLVGVAIIRKW
jgi:hypothetical protein